ncbi:MAG: arginine--tRNA ligase [Parcubacteria group bacterium]|nr:arginine--tRNA ligase [Parcubacteria group bacterium]
MENSVEIIAHFKKKIRLSLHKRHPSVELSEDEFTFEKPPKNEFGDISFICFKLAKKIGISSQTFAEEIAETLKRDLLTDKTSITGGYLNIFLRREKIAKIITDDMHRASFGALESGKKKRIIIEFSQPNPNKPQHIGHLRNNALGDSCAKILSAVGYETKRLNLINDRGIHIVKSMVAYKKWGEEKLPESENMKGDHFVGKWYVLFEQKLKEDPSLMEEARAMLVQWEKADRETRALWKTMTMWAITGFSETYKKLDIAFDEIYYESDIYELGKKIIRKALKKGLCYKRDDGAIEIDLTPYGLDKKVLLRADGTSIYITQDIGLAELKQKKYKPTQSLYIVASEQNYYFKAFFKILELFGYEWAKNLHHLSYGMVFLPEGKMKSREGRVVDADDLIAQMQSLAKGEILAREPNIAPTELEERAHFIALGAIKFYLLKFTPQQDFVFDLEKSISFEGATGPYAQYTAVRIKNIIEKNDSTNQLIEFSLLTDSREWDIVCILFYFYTALEESARTYNPSTLCTYLLELSQKTNEYYHAVHILSDDNQTRKNTRIYLLEGVYTTLKKGLELLGIEIPNKM